MTNGFIVDGTVAALVAILVQFLLKPLLEVWVKPDAPPHDALVRAVALIAGIVLMAVDALIGAPPPADGHSWLLLIGSGAIAGLTSIGAYHALTGSANSATPATPAPTAADLATAVAAALEPLLARLVPVTPARSLTLDTTNQKLVDFPSTNATAPSFSPSPLHVAAGLADPPKPEPAPQSPQPGPATPVAKPAE